MHSDELICSKAGFTRIVRKIAGGQAHDLANASAEFQGRFTSEALVVLQIAAEKYVTDHFYLSYDRFEFV